MNAITPPARPRVDPYREFMSLFAQTARYHHRFEVFRDFVALSAISLHNAVDRCDRREKEYLSFISRYKGDDPNNFARLLALTVEALDAGPEDFLGRIFMDLEMGDARRGQFYTPNSLSKMIAAMQFQDIDDKLSRQPFITLSEPACGAGGMILPLIDLMLQKGHNPSERIWVQAVDVDRTAAMMCYIQLSLWNVPAEIIVGNALTLEIRETWKTPAYHLFGWKMRLHMRGMQDTGF
jgi:type I restriction-modification system DNA methylase subunit